MKRREGEAFGSAIGLNLLLFRIFRPLLFLERAQSVTRKRKYDEAEPATTAAFKKKLGLDFYRLLFACIDLVCVSSPLFIGTDDTRSIA